MPNTTPETMDFLKAAHNGPPVYHALCLRLAREARGIASLYPSALAAQQATPQQRRISWADVRKGHIAYFDDPSDGNSFGHVATCAGRTGDGRRLWWTNDAKRSGGVDLVADPSTDTSWFGAHWGDRFVFATDWVNGVRFHIKADGTAAARPSRRPTRPRSTSWCGWRCGDCARPPPTPRTPTDRSGRPLCRRTSSDCGSATTSTPDADEGVSPCRPR